MLATSVAVCCIVAKALRTGRKGSGADKISTRRKTLHHAPTLSHVASAEYSSAKFRRAHGGPT